MDTHGHECKVFFAAHTLAYVLLRFIMLYFVNFMLFMHTFIHCHYYRYYVVASS